MKKFLKFAELGFTLFALLIYAGGSSGIMTLVLSGGAGETDIVVDYDTSLSKAVYVLIYLITFVLLALRWKKSIYVLSKDRFIFVLIGVYFLSLLWSFQPEDTLKYWLNLLGSGLFGLYFTSRYTLRQQLLFLATLCGLFIVLSFLFALGLPQYGIMTGVHAGKWRGMFLHKNGLGKAMTMSIMIFFLFSLGKNKYFFLPWIGLGLSTVLMLLSQSTSSLLLSIEMVGIILILRTLRLKLEILVPVLLLIITLAVAFLNFLESNAGNLLLALGKDSSLTGRGPLWEAIWLAILKHPWLGYGYEGFFKGWDTESAKIWYIVGWTPTHPHNGLLAILIELGLLGLIIYSIGMFRGLFLAIVYLRSSKTFEGLWPLAYLIWVILNNISETNIITFNDLASIIFISINFFLQLPLEDTLEKPKSLSDTTLSKPVLKSSF